MYWAERYFSPSFFTRIALGMLVTWAWLPDFAEAQRSPSGSRSLRAPVQRSAPSSRAFRSPSRSGPSRTFSAPSRSASSSGARELGERIGSRLGSVAGGRSNTPILDALLGNRSNDTKDGLGTLGDIFRNNRYDRRGYDDNDDFADAYLAVGLANAAVGLVGVLAENNRYRYGPGYAPANHYGDSCAYCRAEASYAPAPQPQRIVTERVLVEQGRYEQSEVWIPESYNPNTGQKLGGGFYETRTRYIPPQYQYREVSAGH
jgi:hypothetical protein